MTANEDCSFREPSAGWRIVAQSLGSASRSQDGRLYLRVEGDPTRAFVPSWHMKANVVPSFRIHRRSSHRVVVLAVLGVFIAGLFPMPMLSPHPPSQDGLLYPCKGGTCGYGIFGARSNHGSGVHMVRCDGSVSFVPNSIDLRVWRAYGTRSGGEVVSEDF